MKAMILERVCNIGLEPRPLRYVETGEPFPGEGEALLRVSACGVCHTELDEIEGRALPPRFPVIPGHQIVGTVAAIGPGVRQLKAGDRVGVAWIYSACGTCKFCRRGEENLCSQFKGTGRDVDGGYAEFMKVGEAFCYPIPNAIADSQAAPLLCAGAIGYRSLRLSNIAAGQRLGLTGFGASAHLVLKMVRHRHPDVPVYVFARSEKERSFARELGAVWSGDTTEASPELLDAVIDTTPVWKPDVEALKNLEPGGRLVINAIRKEDRDKESLLALDYPAHLWLEKEIKSVANVTRRDVTEFLQLAAEMKIQPEVQEYPLKDANRALTDLRSSTIRGAKVLRVQS